MKILDVEKHGLKIAGFPKKLLDNHNKSIDEILVKNDVEYGTEEYFDIIKNYSDQVARRFKPSNPERQKRNAVMKENNLTGKQYRKLLKLTRKQLKK